VSFFREKFRILEIGRPERPSTGFGAAGKFFLKPGAERRESTVGSGRRKGERGIGIVPAAWTRNHFLFYNENQWFENTGFRNSDGFSGFRNPSAVRRPSPGRRQFHCIVLKSRLTIFYPIVTNLPSSSGLVRRRNQERSRHGHNPMPFPFPAFAIRHP
jgi:hypothetical protein